jgi:subtilisin family serine protease
LCRTAGWLATAFLLGGVLFPARQATVTNVRPVRPASAAAPRDGGGPSDALSAARQGSTIPVAPAASGLPPDLSAAPAGSGSVREIPGRRVPPLIRAQDLQSAAVAGWAVPLPQANTLAHLNFRARRFGRLQTAQGRSVRFNPEMVLVKFRGQSHVAAVRVAAGGEWAAARVLAGRPDVELAELDCLQHRAGAPDDPLITNQWHHALIGSFRAWERCLGSPAVRIAIVDQPFQMAHPDLAAHVTNGWDVVLNVPVTASTGSVHSTMCAGMAAAVIQNHLGVAGAGNCTLLPISINGFISEMCNAVYWSATNGVRVVSLSWEGANSDALNAAGAYLRTTARGLLVMAGVNGTGYLNYPSQPDIWCVAMTDAADNLQSCAGAHIDFAAPGWGIFSTTTGGGYTSGTGTSYATPLLAGVVAVLLSLNPTLGAEDAMGLLQQTAVDRYGSGWNPFFGWGRIDFGAAVDAAWATLPVITGLVNRDGQVVVSAQGAPGLTCTLWRSAAPGGDTWTPVSEASLPTNGGTCSFLDPHPLSSNAFYRVQARLP